MDPGSISPAVVGAIGVVLGSSITALPTYFQSQWEGRRVERAERVRSAADLRLAARLVAVELDEASQLVAQSAKAHRSWHGDHVLPTSAWNEHRGNLAGALGPADWQRLTEAYDGISELNWTGTKRRGNVVTLDSGGPVERPPHGDQLAGMWISIRYAIGVLQLEVGDLAIPIAKEFERAEHLWPGSFRTPDVKSLQ